LEALTESSETRVTLSEKKRAPADEKTNELELKVEATQSKAADAAEQLFNKKANASHLEVEKTEMSAALKAEQAKCREAVAALDKEKAEHPARQGTGRREAQHPRHAARREGRRIHGRATGTPTLAPIRHKD
jgi:hypothetical protein